jgi:hypothetical protein
MIYFTDMLLVPGDGDAPKDIRKAMAGSGMVRCAQVEMEPDIEIDWNRLQVDFMYGKVLESDIGHIMANNYEEDTEVGGAYGGPGGWDFGMGAPMYEPEVASTKIYGRVVIRIKNYDQEYYDGLDQEGPYVLSDALQEWLTGSVDPGWVPGSDLEWHVRKDENDEFLFSADWNKNLERPEDDGPDYDDYDDYDDGPGVGFPPADYDPYGGP